MASWIKLHRSLSDWEWATNPIMVSVWIHFLIDANFEDKRYQGSVIKRGQFLLGLAEYAVKCGITVHRLRTCIDRLKTTSEITTETSNRGTVVTITAYDLYQSGCDETASTSASTSTNKRQTDGKQMATPKELKNIRTKEKNTLSLSLSPELEEAAKGFIEMRTRIKKPLNQNALDLMLNKLDGMTDVEAEKIAILNESIMNSWQGIFPLKIFGISRALAEEQAIQEWVNKP